MGSPIFPPVSGGGGTPGDLQLGETSSTAYRGDRGKTAYDHTSLTNNPHSVTAAQAGAEPANANIQAHISSVANPHLFPNDNYLINPSFEVNQEKNASVNSSGAYPVDDWAVYAVGSTFVASQQSFILGQTDVPGEPKNYMRVVTTSSAGAGNYIRVSKRIEFVRTLAGKTVTLSWYGKTDASNPVSIEFVQTFGTGGSPSSAVTGTGILKQTMNTTFTRYTTTVSIPSISGKTIGTDNNDYLEIVIWLDAGSDFNSRTGSLGQQSGTFEFANVKLEEGLVATPFVVSRFDNEMIKCMRFWQKSYNYSTAPGTSSASVGRIAARSENAATLTTSCAFPVALRATPTITIYSPTSGAPKRVQGWADGQTYGTDALTVVGVGEKSLHALYDGASPFTANTLYFYHYAASARL